MADPAADYLRTLHTSDRARAAAWDAVYAKDDADAQRRLRELPFSDDVRADLWDIRNGASVSGGSAPQAATAEQFMDPQPQAPQGSALSRGAAGAWEYLNPLTIASGLYQTVRHPFDTAMAAGGQMKEQWGKAADAYQRGDYTEATGRAFAGSLPLIGPAAAETGDYIAETGDVAGGIGRGFALAAPGLVRPAVSATARATRGAINAIHGATERIAGTLERGAQSRVVDVIAPKVGANKTRIGNDAAKVAPKLAQDLATDGAPMSRSGFKTQVEAKMAEAEAGLDAAADARNATAAIETKPIIDALVERRRQLTAEAVQADRRYPQYEGTARVARAGEEFQASGSVNTADIPPHQRGYRTVDEQGQFTSEPARSGVAMGEDVVPGPNANRVAVIDQAIKELEALGPVARYEPLRRIRQAYDGPAKAVYSPSMTADYLKAQGGKLGAADVTGVLRETLAKADPETAVANASYSLYRTTNDILRAAEEVERTRPKVGRAIMARLTGALIGGQSGGTVGAIAGYAGAPLIDSLVNAGATTQLQTAAVMQRLATAVRSGDLAAVDAMLGKLRSVAVRGRRAATVPQATSPSGSQSDPIPALP